MLFFLTILLFSQLFVALWLFIRFFQISIKVERVSLSWFTVALCWQLFYIIFFSFFVLFLFFSCYLVLPRFYIFLSFPGFSTSFVVSLLSFAILPSLLITPQSHSRFAMKSTIILLATEQFISFDSQYELEHAFIEHTHPNGTKPMTNYTFSHMECLWHIIRTTNLCLLCTWLDSKRFVWLLPPLSLSPSVVFCVLWLVCNLQHFLISTHAARENGKSGKMERKRERENTKV